MSAQGRESKRLANLSGTGRIYLTGSRGSGKTTVGRLLAASIGYGFCDLDNYLCSREGRSVAEIVAEAGWQEFRRLEEEVLREASIGSNLVFATGGGVVLSPANRTFLQQAGRVIWLQAPVAELAARLARNPLPGQRPSLTDLDHEAEIARVLSEREPLYAACCHDIINGAQEPVLVCNDILRALDVYA